MCEELALSRRRSSEALESVHRVGRTFSKGFLVIKKVLSPCKSNSMCVNVATSKGEENILETE